VKRNLTLSVDEESYRHAKVVAARRGQSVSMLVREYFESLDGEADAPSRPASSARSSQSLLQALGDERLADVDLDLPEFNETVRAPEFK
jgi:hypothetical protein